MKVELWAEYPTGNLGKRFPCKRFVTELKLDGPVSDVDLLAFIEKRHPKASHYEINRKDTE